MEKSAESCKSPRHKPEPDQPICYKAPRRVRTTLSFATPSYFDHGKSEGGQVDQALQPYCHR